MTASNQLLLRVWDWGLATCIFWFPGSCNVVQGEEPLPWESVSALHPAVCYSVPLTSAQPGPSWLVVKEEEWSKWGFSNSPGAPCFLIPLLVCWQAFSLSSRWGELLSVPLYPILIGGEGGCFSLGIHFSPRELGLGSGRTECKSDVCTSEEEK